MKADLTFVRRRCQTAGVVIAVALLAACASSSPVPATTVSVGRIQNGDFEAEPVVESARGAGKNANELPGWRLVREEGAQGDIARESSVPMDENNPHSLRLTVKTPGLRCGVANEGDDQMRIEKDEWYDLTFHARSEPRENNRGYGLMVSLETSDGKKVCARATIPEVAGGSWKSYTLPLHARESDSKARLVISLDEPGVIWFDAVSLLPRSASRPASEKSN